jgi:GT2 family glycosyltransferase
MAGFDHLHSRDVAQPPGSCFVIAREEYLDLGGLDEELFLFFNDVDLCKRLFHRGRRIRYLADAVVEHHRGASTRGFRKFLVTWHRNRLHYYRKHFGPLVLPYMRLVVRLRAVEEWFKIGRRERDPLRRRAERAFLRDSLHEVLAQ